MKTLSFQSSLLAMVALPAILLILALVSYDPLNIAAWSIPWVPSYDVSFSLRMDGLSMLFVSMIAGIGFLIQIYALSYMKKSTDRVKFHLYLTLFMMAMLGMVLADDIILLFVFWELTTVTSYLLIGFKHESEDSRKKALQAMLLTAAGGLCLLAGLIILGNIAGTYQISEMIARAETIQGHALFLPSLVLILLGAFTKSAQFPFHFWLPNAMAAPTPVSAYLHSATMVKAGIYLLARFSPLYGQEDLWFYSLSIFGGATAIWCAFMAIRENDLKLMLAHSTNVALGTIIFLLAFGTGYAVAAALLFIIAHALYKASLFMVIGNIDLATGTRDIKMLSGLKPILFITFLSASLAALSKAGFPPFLGFLSKEYMYKAMLELPVWNITTLFIVNGFMVALAMLVVIRPFLGQKSDIVSKTKTDETKKETRDLGLLLPPVILSILSVLAPVLALSTIVSQIIVPGGDSVLPATDLPDVKIWQGFNLPLLLSGLTFGFGVFLYSCYRPVVQIMNMAFQKIPTGSDIFQKTLSFILDTGHAITVFIQNGKLSLYVLISFGTLAGLCLFAIGQTMPDFGLYSFSGHMYEWMIAAFLVLSAWIVVWAPSKLLALCALGSLGFFTTMTFMIYASPDVAKTQILVEILLIIFILLIVRHIRLQNTSLEHNLSRRALHLGIAGIIGASVTLYMLVTTRQPLDQTITGFFAENSVPGGYGRNIVNVILVDFRAFDTLGEIIVVVIACFAAAGLFKNWKAEK